MPAQPAPVRAGAQVDDAPGHRARTSHDQPLLCDRRCRGRARAVFHGSCCSCRPGGNAPYSHAVPVRPVCLPAGHARAMPAAIVMSFSMPPTLNSGRRPPRRVQAGGYRHSAPSRWCGFPHDCMSLEPERRRAPSLRLRPRKTREFRHGTPQFKAWPAMARRPPPAVRGGRKRVCAPRPAPWPRWHGPCSAGQLERDRRRHRLDADSARATWIRP